MWQFNIISINNLLLALLLLIMFVYLLSRAEKTREIFSLLAFIAILILWQASHLLTNTLFDPVSAYPLYYFHNSGITVLGYTGLAVFSYDFIKPVFDRERKIVFLAGLVIGFLLILHALFVEFPVSPRLRFDQVFDVYTADPTPLRKYIIFVQVLLSLLVVKNMVYKAAVLRGEARRFALRSTLAIALGLLSVPVVYALTEAGGIEQSMMNTVLAVIASFVIVYFFWSYVDRARIRFLYSDKIRLILLFFLMIIIGAVISFTFMVYRDSYFRGLEEVVRGVAFDVKEGRQDRDYYERRYGDSVESITMKVGGDARDRFLHGFRGFFPLPGNMAHGEIRRDTLLRGERVILCYTVRIGDDMIQVGFPYAGYRRQMHEFVSVGFFTTLGVIMLLFLFLPAMVSVSLINPMRGLLNGIEELQRGNLDHMIEVASLDEIGYITDQFNTMVDDIRERGERVEKSEKKYRELTALLPDIIYETDMELRITYLNEAGRAMTGYGADDLSRGLMMSDIMDENDYAMIRELVSRKAEDSAVSIFTHRVRRRDGGFFYGENNAGRIVSEGRVEGLRGVIRDVTEKMRLEQRLVQSQKMEIIGSLAGGIAHDFNNILGGIFGSISLMEFKIREGIIGPGALDEDIVTMKISAERGMKMVERILGISRRQRLAMGVVDLNRIAEHVRDICRNTFDRKIELDFRIDDGTPAVVIGDATQLEQVLLNLCINAHDAMTVMRPPDEERRGTLAVQIDHVPADGDFLARYPDASEIDYVRMRVEDGGVGMDSFVLDRVFDPFFTTKENLRGTGLGLAMVYNIVKQHYGFIDVESRVGVGTAFTVFIPSTELPEIPREELEEAGHTMGKGVILLIEDDPTIQKTCGKILGILGYDVIVAENGQRGIDIYRERHGEIDAVILDMVMPKRSGKETFVELKSIEPSVRVLVSSGFRNDSRIDDVLALGARAFLQKPYTMEQLSKVLAEILSEKDG
ncbi:MAG: response regulator [Spirochaetes bacterium]|nr:response regulator [Spirochaetota bacterium]